MVSRYLEHPPLTTRERKMLGVIKQFVGDLDNHLAVMGRPAIPRDTMEAGRAVIAEAEGRAS